MFVFFARPKKTTQRQAALARFWEFGFWIWDFGLKSCATRIHKSKIQIQN